MAKSSNILSGIEESVRFGFPKDQFPRKDKAPTPKAAQMDNPVLVPGIGVMEKEQAEKYYPDLEHRPTTLHKKALEESIASITSMITEARKYNEDLLVECCKELTVKERVAVKNINRALIGLYEAELTAQQVDQIFAGVEQGATAAGSNRTMLGKGKDAAGAVSQAWGDLKAKIYNSKPMENFAAQYDKAAEKLKQATGGDSGAMQYVQKYRDFATKHQIGRAHV